MFKLNKLKKLVKKRKQIGRGGSRGGTSGRGHKGQKARTGDHGVGLGFEGGQMPLARRLPKRGFNNKRFETRYSLVNLDDLERVFNEGDEVTRERLIETGLIQEHKSDKRQFVKVLGRGDLTKKLKVYVHAASKRAEDVIKKTKGSLEIIREI